MSDRYMTISEVAGELKVHWQTVRGYIKRGELPAVKVRRRVRILESDLRAFVTKIDKAKQVQEIEVRFVTTDRRTIEQNIIRLGGKVIYHGHVIDHYFAPRKIANIAQKNEFYDLGGDGLRIREQDNGYTGKMVTTLENKRLVVPYKHDTCWEEEIAVESYERARSFLASMDMKEFVALDKDRVVYKLDGVKIVIDDIKNFKTGIEIEMMTSDSREVVLPQLLGLADKIGLAVETQKVEKSVTHMYMLEFAQF